MSTICTDLHAAARVAAHGINATLSEEIQYITPFTYIVDDLTRHVEKTWQKRLIQVLTYISRPLDTAVQLIATPLFALYKTLKGIYGSFKEGDVCTGLGKILLSPYTFAYHTFKDAVSASVWGVLNLVPTRTIADIHNPIRSLSRLKTLEDENSFLYRVQLTVPEAAEVQEHLKHSVTLKRINLFGVSHEHPKSMAVRDVYDYSKKPHSGCGWLEFRTKEWISNHLFLRPNIFAAV